MKTARTAKTRLGLLAALLLAAAVLVPAASASAAAGPVWDIASTSNTTANPGTTFEYFVSVRNTGGSVDGSTVTLKVDLPPGLTGVSSSSGVNSVILSCPDSMVGASSFTCTGNPSYVTGTPLLLRVALDADAQPGESLTAAFEIEGGGAESPAQTVSPIRVTDSPPSFGVAAFDGSVLDASGAPSTQAAGHPDSQSTEFDVALAAGSPSWRGERAPVEDIKRVSVELPPGFVGNPDSAETCSSSDLGRSDSTAPEPLCPEESQIGVATIRFGGDPTSTGSSWGPNPLFNMVPPPGVPARFGFNVLGTVVLLDAHVRSDGDYGLTVTSGRTPQALVITGTTVTIWGVPSDEKHKSERSCAGEQYPFSGGHTCDSKADPQAFLRNPTSCSSEGLETRIKADSWQHPGVFSGMSYRSHEAPGYPLSPEPSTFPASYSGPTEWGPEVGIDGCAAVPFEPTFSAQPTTNAADSPSGLKVDLAVPQDCWDPAATPEEALAPICQSDLKAATVTLPEGMSINPSSAGGLGACGPAQIGLSTPVGQSSPIHFGEDPITCPDASKIGTVQIDTPLLSEPLSGAVYLAQQGQNPFGSLLSMYLVAEGSGVIIKQAGEIVSDPATGRLVTHFADAPQLPFSNLHLELYGGPRAALRTPTACGSYQTQASLTPWARPDEELALQSTFRISQGCGGGFDPKLQAGTANPLAGNYSPFNLRLSRGDGSQELGSLQVTLPPGLVGSLKGYTYCPDSVLAAISSGLGTGKGQEGSPSCPASSRVGAATVGAGAGPNPFYTEAPRAYLAGPYKGAPVSLAVVAPAVAGPFDLGSVVVRNAIRVDPTTAQLTVDSDPLPHILHGIPLDLRDVRVTYDYTLNPTNCEAMQIGSRITSTTGATASPSVHFQVAGCDRLGFKPRFSLSLSGPTHRAAHPRLRAVLRARPGDANIGRATVLLPKTELLENAHIRTVCTRVQFAANGGGGAGCPKGSIYGYAKAWTPLLDEPLRGPVYLRANGGERELPDLVAALDGQIHVDLVGYIDSVHSRIRNRFMIVPDAPVTKFELTMQGADKGLLANNTNLCNAKPRASAVFGAQNGRSLELRPLVKAGCGKSRK